MVHKTTDDREGGIDERGVAYVVCTYLPLDNSVKLEVLVRLAREASATNG